MELLHHIGLSAPENPQETADTIRALLILSGLSIFAVIYSAAALFLFLPLRLFPESVSYLKRLLARKFWSLCSALIFKYTTITLSGDPLLPQPAIVVCNHQSLADHVLIPHLAQSISSDPLLAPRVNFFTWFHLWRVPTIKILLNMMKCDENWELDDNLANRTLAPVASSKLKEWVVLFPEVSIWCDKSSALSSQQAQKYFLPQFSHVLYPRFSAFYNVARSLNKSSFKTIYDLTITYSHPTLMQILTRSTEIHVHVKSRAFRVSPERRAVEKYLEKVWIEKEAFLQD